MTSKIVYPGGDDDWGRVFDLILATAKYWRGRTRLAAESVRRGNDNSLLPVAMPDPDGWSEGTLEWTGDDYFEDLLESPNGQTIATHMSGSGLYPEFVKGALGADIESAIWSLMEKKNPDVDDISDDGSAYQWVIEEAEGFLNDFSSFTIDGVVQHIEKMERTER